MADHAPPSPSTPPDMNYGDYLSLDGLLAQQHPRSAQHDELLFIIIHQVQELWIRLVLHELDGAMASIRRGDLPAAFKGTSRVSQIQAQLIRAWDVLSTMTPADYLSFRPALGRSSGFQSHQYRLFEFRLGAKDRAMLAPHEGRPTHALLLEALNAPSIYDEALRLLARRGFAIPQEVLERDLTLPHRPNAAVEAAWETIYRDTGRHFDLYELAEELMDVEDAFQQWRFRHAKTVERIIGLRSGTGGTAGVAYLRQALERSFFPELWSVRTRL
jgi:tryptophan 2,3-dioxygenase